MEKEADKILSNIIELAELLDEEMLKNAADVPIMELAKSVSIKKAKHGKSVRVNRRDGVLCAAQKRDARVLAVARQPGKLPRSCG